VKRRKRSQRLSKGLDDFRALSTRILQFSTYEVEDTNDAPHPAANVNPKWRAEIREGPSVERSKETLDLDSDDETDRLEREYCLQCS
jgi:hypothetical protein